jgi:hypothetical protein
MKEQHVSTAEILDSIARERQRLMAAVRALDDRATTASVTAEGWTAKDVIAHLIHWAGQLAWALGAPMKVPAWVEAVGGKRLEGDNAWNDLVVEHHREIPLADVVREFDRAVDFLVHQLRTRDDIDVNASAKAAISWLPADKALWQVIAGETYAHWPAHSADIERAAQVTA